MDIRQSQRITTTPVFLFLTVSVIVPAVAAVSMVSIPVPDAVIPPSEPQTAVAEQDEKCDDDEQTEKYRSERRDFFTF